MRERIKKGLSLGNIKSVAWHIVGEDQFKPMKILVRFEDVEGKVFELVIHSPLFIKEWYDEVEVILNFLLSSYGIMPKGEWIGFTHDLDKIINMCRKELPYEGKFYINEDNPWEDPEHVF